MIKAHCHCRNVELKFKQLPESLTICNCSICSRYSVKWIYFECKEVEIKVKNKTTQYIWGDKCIAFHHCSICGCVTHYTALEESEMDRVAVNANLLEDTSLVNNLSIRKFNGADM